ncbi:replication-associated protein, putative [Entamoeba dispar SAW760]|uniref:ATP-dependent helicase Rep n=1 Tax=Entamoeba dispar (strain ATCC PRA-260 / SAW760) TaxID=370354 RepID=B0EJ40_ENTDS|nr:replication-associated protein, putative [Entamoeba dispar SAW760]EDR25456.1 replication-associated protein, putative [Entamoeba dispar SAW760]|eukprot:EDR25456.1 replication-associated protein, putative [Entamoeba dispar SAW760]
MSRVAAASCQARRFFITINNPSDDEITTLETLDYKYIVIAQENAPTTGTPHIHCLVLFNSAKRISTLKRLLPRANIQVVRGTFHQAREYVIKDGQIIYEDGAAPRLGIGDTFKQMVQEAKAGTIDTESLMYCRYEKFFQRFIPKTDYCFDGELNTKNAWIYGPPGTGKSRLVRDYARSRGYRVYEKLSNKWWDNYDGEEIVLIEDLDPQVCKLLVHHIKLWADRYPFRAKIKGGSVRLEPRFQFIVTSNYSLAECFE